MFVDYAQTSLAMMKEIASTFTAQYPLYSLQCTVAELHRNNQLGYLDPNLSIWCGISLKRRRKVIQSMQSYLALFKVCYLYARAVDSGTQRGPENCFKAGNVTQLIKKLQALKTLAQMESFLAQIEDTQLSHLRDEFELNPIANSKKYSLDRLIETIFYTHLPESQYHTGYVSFFRTVMYLPDGAAFRHFLMKRRYLDAVNIYLDSQESRPNGSAVNMQDLPTTAVGSSLKTTPALSLEDMRIRVLTLQREKAAVIAKFQQATSATLQKESQISQIRQLSSSEKLKLVEDLRKLYLTQQEMELRQKSVDTEIEELRKAIRLELVKFNDFLRVD